MATVIAQEASLFSLLGSMRGEIVAARLGYPDVLHIEIRDSDGDLSAPRHSGCGLVAG